MLEAVSGFWDVGLGFRVCGLRIIELTMGFWMYTKFIGQKGFMGKFKGD